MSYFAPNSASTVMTQHPGQLQHIVNVSSNSGRFCKYSRVFLNLVCGDQSHFYSAPLLVTAPIASMILDQVARGSGKPSGNWPGRCLQIRPEVLRKTLWKVVWKIVRKTVRNLQTPLFVVFGVPECRLENCPEKLPENCHENFRKKAQKIPGLVTDRSA